MTDTPHQVPPLQELAAFLDNVLKEIYGERMSFSLHIGPFNTDTGRGDYVSNSSREDMIKTLEAFLKDAKLLAAQAAGSVQ